ncbi:MAG: hypothetical protein ACRCTZ_14310 [Sarcina sp.]
MFDHNKLEHYFDSIKLFGAKSIKFSNTKIGIDSTNTMYVTFYKIDGNINLKSDDLNKLKEAVALFLL